jgi:HPt (histidine-containing phosphotransfer) domain-containing protein
VIAPILDAMANAELDLQRLAQIEQVMGAKLPEIVGGIVQSLSTAISQLEEAMGSGEWQRAAKAAHAARNDALMIGAKRLLVSLTEIETSAREERGADAERALVDMRATWPGTRAELVRVASGG